MEGLWQEWERLTRFLESSRVVFAREEVLWKSLDLADFDGARIRTTRDQVTYDVDLDDHLATLGDEEILWGSVLVHTFALTQSAAEEKLEIDLRTTAGIEDWGGKLLKSAGKTWGDVKGGMAGAVEVAVVRNAVAHGTRTINPNAAGRLRKAGSNGNAREGSRVTLTYQNLRGYRIRLKSLLNAGGLGKS